MKVKLRGKTYDYCRRLNVEVDGEKVDGYCDPPNCPNKAVVVDSQLEGFDELETNLHELNHGCFWDVKEEVINEVSKDIARVLWRLGYRKRK